MDVPTQGLAQSYDAELSYHKVIMLVPLLAYLLLPHFVVGGIGSRFDAEVTRLMTRNRLTNV